MSPHSWPAIPSWAYLTGDAGRILIWVALTSFLISLFSWIYSPKNAKLALLGKITFVVGALSFFGALFCLGSLFVNNQFEYNYVFQHGDASTDLKYKIAGIWAGQQGSFLLWACTSSLFACFALIGAGPYRRYFSIFCSIFLAALAGILAYETPYAITAIQGKWVVPPVGAGLTPALQNYWVVIHPPTIFSGFGSLVVAAAYGFAAMMSKDVTGYVRRLRPWAIVSASILGLGLAFGGFWAYETLGWGGFWAWDPVESVSFVPWIFELALIHGLIVQTAKKQWFGPNLVFAGLPFFIFCYGTFLTRSGFLANASVHSFAQMNHFALWILAGFVLAGTIAYFGLYMARGRKLAREAEPEVERSLLDRQKLYGLGVIFLCALGATTAIGMSVPFILDLMNKNPKVVDAHDYNQVVVWFFIPILIAMGVAPFVTWRSMGLQDLGKRLGNILLLSLGASGLIVLSCHLIVWDPANPGSILFAKLQIPTIPWTAALVTLCAFVAIANIWRLFETVRRSAVSVGGFIAHIGIATLMAGMIISTAFQEKQSVLLEEGDSVKALGYTIQYQGMSHPEQYGLLNRDNKVLFSLTGPSNSFTARPGLYYTMGDDGKPKPQVWPHLEHFAFYDIYFTLFAPQFDVWPEPIEFAPGQTQDPGGRDIQVTYKGFQMIGAPGATGTKFVADAIVHYQDGNKAWHTYEVHPSIEIGQNAPSFSPIGKDLAISLEGINPQNNGASLQVHFAAPIYPIDLFYKPMTILVWLGAALTFLGGIISAFYRRNPRVKTPKPPKPQLPPEEDLDPGANLSENLVGTGV